MILSTVRYASTDRVTIGSLFVDGIMQCYSLEDAYHERKVPGQTRIPAGSYRVGLRYSPKFTPRYGHDMLWVQGVPGFEWILIHRGNSAKDTEGCLLVGSQVDGETLKQSTFAYNQLYRKVVENAKNGELWLTMIDFN